MTGYCVRDVKNKKYPFYCDWNDGYYFSLTDCYKYCYGYSVNGQPVHISKADMEVMGATAGILFGAVFLFALFKALISG